MRPKPVLVLLEAPPVEPGAPMPVMLADDSRLTFGYIVKNWESYQCAVFSIHFDQLRFGSPNDEALEGHRYFDLGMDYYEAYEVLNSEWVDEVMAVNRVSFPDRDDLFDGLRHFIFLFHDTTLEFLSKDMPAATLTNDNLLDAVMTVYRA